MESEISQDTNIEEPSSTTNKKSNSKALKIIAILTALAIGVGMVVAAYVWKENQKVAPPRDLSETEKEMIWKPPTATTTVSVSPDVSTSTVEEREILEVVDSDEEEIERKVSKPSWWTARNSSSTHQKYDIQVSWLSAPIQTSLNQEEFPFKVDGLSRVYEVGEVTNGSLLGKKVFLTYSFGMAIDYPEGVFVLADIPIEITEWVDEVGNLPEEILNVEMDLVLHRGPQFRAGMNDIEDYAGYGDEESIPISPLQFSGLEEISDQTLYSFLGCLFARTPADLVVEYNVTLPFLAEQPAGFYGTTQITFDRIDGERITQEYRVHDTVGYGCGSLCSPLAVVDLPDEEFVKTGTTDSGHDLFVLKDVYAERYQELYQQKNTRAFVDTTSGSYKPLDENKYSYEEFINLVPYLYWKDPFGRWAEFLNTEFTILAEKCKPVIYLYPEKETDLHVEVSPNFGFTKTIPEYDGGWNVTAYPDGTIIDPETNKEYDYLYWAGLVDNYPLPKEGWVVAYKDIPTFFDHYLPQYGLQGREIDDFTEYWIEDLDEAPFYAISFLDQALIDQLSPLAIDKDPDVVIRILMTAKPLERPIPLKTPRVPNVPERTGFTVIEWGGVILR